jgi:hypothetical protein
MRKLRRHAGLETDLEAKLQSSMMTAWTALREYANGVHWAFATQSTE